MKPPRNHTMKNLNPSLLMLLSLLFLLNIACNLNPLPIGDLRQESGTIEAGQAQTLEANLNMGLGELRVSSGAKSLADIKITYNVDAWKPKVSYEVENDVGQLEIRQPEGNREGFPNNNLRYEWDIQLNNNIPTDLNVKTGVSDATLSLEDMELKSLSLETGMSEVKVSIGNSSLKSSIPALVLAEQP